MNEVFAKMEDGNRHFILKACLVLGQVEVKQYIRGYKLAPKVVATPNVEIQEEPNEDPNVDAQEEPKNKLNKRV